MPMRSDDVYADVYEVDKPDTDEFGRAKRDHRIAERERDRHERPRHRDREYDRYDRSERPARHRSRSPRRRRDDRRRSRSPRFNRSRDRSESPDVEIIADPGPSLKKSKRQTPLTASDMDSKGEDEMNMQAIMGFGGFDTTKNKKVDGNDTYVANIVRKRRYRQYMNRKGGFNRPLDFIA